MHRLIKPIHTFSAPAPSEGGSTGASEAGDSGTGGEGAEKTFTQADIDQIVGRTRTEERRKASEKYADYDDLKSKAEGAKTLEDRIADLETKGTQSEQRALRAEIANAKGLTPGQAKRLVGTTREELEADANELLQDIGARKKRGNHVPSEGATKTPGDDAERAAVRQLFGSGS